eukprot:CAMPEP_0197320132 /NCGR_PEP_ID=MMETSP0891-20130614/57821_1 /TAXON_ID=44058 ORGANISM="Aureoumbra lagunensis, Strain CCMP1510" /NCGR_SAMPLE_ID=MMETSP0891 /ASSEMBLY_ACC=CAM_ASM_000534 /LENGTH=491 /DNA_ID=CAMNT_0042811369 /DNA_START=55 /DNA_END=1530 /DNA_ORIENTATION=+
MSRTIQPSILLVSKRLDFRPFSFTARGPPKIIEANTEVSTLENGLRVCTENISGETVTVGVYIDAGSRYEAASNNGVAHFLEHMIFKGTKTRKQRELEVMIEDMGAQLNAYTSREQTVYYTKLFKKDIETGMEILADILQNSIMSLSAIERERDVILREMEEVNKQHEELVLDLLHDAAFKNGGLGRTILGPQENIETISRRDLYNYIETHYTAPRMVIAAAGALDHDYIVHLSQKFFGSYPKESRTDFPVDFDQAQFTPTENRIIDHNEPQAHIALAYEGAHWTSAFSVPLMILQTMIGYYDRLSTPANAAEDSPYPLIRSLANASFDFSSHLSQQQQQQQFEIFDVCHSYMAMNTSYKDTGLITFYFVSPPQTAKITISIIQTYLASLSKPGSFDEHDILRAKAQLKANIISQLDALNNVCEDIGRQYLTYHRRMPLAEVIARIDAVTAEDLRATANHFLTNKPHAMAAYGTIDDLPSYDHIHISNFNK